VEVSQYIQPYMNKKFEYGENDCVLFTSRFWEPKSGKIFKVIKDRIGIDESNWPQSFEELHRVSQKYGYKNVAAMHMRLMREIGFKAFTEKQNGDVLVDRKTHTLGLYWKGMGAFLSDDGVLLTRTNINYGWRI
jgi:hypothetical protein